MRWWVVILMLLAACSGGIVPMTNADKPVMRWPDLLSRAQPKPDATVTYGDDALQVVDIWRPEGKNGFPAVLMIHGGCWQTAIAERDIMNWIADDLRQNGIGVWNIEYRGVDRGGGYPGTFQDIAAAADLLMQKSREYGFATNKIVVIGHSAGGHLALWLSQRQGLAADDGLRGTQALPIALVVSQGGLPDLRAGEQRVGHPCGTDAPRLMAGGEYQRTSPPEMPVSAVPQVLFNADRDHVAPPVYASRYQSITRGRGQKVDTVTIAGEGHVELITPDSQSWAAQRAAILRAFAR